MASRESERKRTVNAALRAVRRVYRTADTAGEKLERALDRMAARKTRPMREDLAPLIPLYQDYKGKLLEIERAMTDLLTVSSY